MTSGFYLEGQVVLDCNPPPTPPPAPPPPPSLRNCGLDPLTCVFFDSVCLAQTPNATKNVALYMNAITRGFNFDNMVGAIISGLGLFTIARWGGIPVPSSTCGSILWLFVRRYTAVFATPLIVVLERLLDSVGAQIVLIQALEYVIVILSLSMVCLGYFHTRHYYRHCMLEARGFGFGKLAGTIVGSVFGLASGLAIKRVSAMLLPWLLDGLERLGPTVSDCWGWVRGQQPAAVANPDQPTVVAPTVVAPTVVAPFRNRSESSEQVYRLNIAQMSNTLAAACGLLLGAASGIIVAGGVPIMDISMMATVWAVPVVNQQLFVMFIYACACAAGRGHPHIHVHCHYLPLDSACLRISPRSCSLDLLESARRGS